MGKGKKRDNKHHGTSNQEGSRGRQASVKKANPPAQTNSLDRPKTSNSTSPTTNGSDKKFSKRKIISNWDRYSEDEVSSKITEEKVVQRLTQLLEQSVLQTSQSDFQPSLDALRDISADDDEDIYTHTFDIDLNYLVDCINSFPIHERLDLNPSYCEDIANSSSATGGNSDVTLEMYPITSEACLNDGVSVVSEHISSVSSLVMVDKKLDKPEEDAINATPLVKDNIDAVTEDEDQLLSKLLAAKTDKNYLVNDSVFKMTTAIDHTKTKLPEVTDEENDNLLEELLAQPI